MKSKIIPFQDRKKCKLAFNAVNINLTQLINQIDSDLWRRIFSNKEESPGYIKIRNNIVHKAIIYTFKRDYHININLILNAIKDISYFVFLVENEIIFRYPIDNYINLYYSFLCLRICHNRRSPMKILRIMNQYEFPKPRLEVS